MATAAAAAAAASSLSISEKDARETSTELSQNVTRRMSKRMKILHIIMTIFVPSAIGFHVDTSYLIRPTVEDCPVWSQSTVVAGAGLMMGVLGLTGLVSGRLLDRYGPGAFLLVGTVTGGLGWLGCGVMVLACESAPIITQVFYIASFACIGVCLGLNYIAAVQSLLSWFPGDRGKANSFNGASRSTGSILIAQLLIFCQTLVETRQMRAGTIYFIVGVILVAATGPFTMLVRFPPGRQPTAGDRRLSLKTIIKTRQFQIIIFGYFANLFPSWGIEGRMDQILRTAWGSPHAPVAQMAFAVLMGYTAGRFVWVFTADCIGIVNVWKICSLIEAVCLFSLPWTMYAETKAGAYASVCLVSIQFAVFSGIKCTVAALCNVTFGTKNASAALGAAMVGYGTGGLTGPLICQFTYSAFGNYRPFLFGSAVLPLLAFIFMWCIKPLEQKEKMSGDGRRAEPSMIEPEPSMIEPERSYEKSNERTPLLLENHSAERSV
ncbi:uncharacterized protein [Oscarella lobularis]|uniref:uncharacterized protein n=1 Tax=Oscarella lobularis TaxID=121494 RepID=UPI0033139568